jgi:hypothetical protein
MSCRTVKTDLPIFCGPCGGEIDPGKKYLEINKTENGFSVETLCQHSRKPNPGSVLVASNECFYLWLLEWTKVLKCNHVM